MENINFQLILTEPNGNYAIPDIIISDSFQTDYAIQSVADISLRKDTISKNITFPGTKNNNRIFNNLYSFNRDSDSSLEEVLYANYSPNVGVRAVLFENNYPLAVGTLKINDIKKNKKTGAYTYEGIITGNLVTFFGKIKDTKVKDLPLFDEDFTYSLSNITGSWAYDSADLFLYPQIDYGNGVTQNPGQYDVRGFRPAVYVRQYVKAILASQGYKYSSSFMDSEIFGRAFVPFSEKDFGQTLFGEVFEFTGISEYEVTMNRSNRRGAYSGLRYTTPDPQNKYIHLLAQQSLHMNNTIQNFGDGIRDRDIDVFEFQKYAYTGVKIDYNFDIFTHSDINTFIYLSVVEVYDGNQITTENGYYARHSFTQPGFGNANYSGTIELPVGDYPAGFRFAVIVETYTLNPLSIGDDLEMTQKTAGNTATVSNPDAVVGSFFNYSLGDTFSLKDAVQADLKAPDMLKSIFQLFNMYAVESKDDDKVLIIEPYDTFYAFFEEPATYALNWSKKIDNATLHMKINTQMPRAYNFLFKEDNDYYNVLYKNTYAETYGNFSINNKNGSAEPKKIEVVFSPTVIVQENGDDKIMPTIFTGDITEKKTMKSNLRILFNNDLAVCNPYNLVVTNLQGGVVEMVSEGYALYQRSHHVLTLFGQSVFNLLFGLPQAVYYPVTGSIYDLPSLYTLLYARQFAELNDDNIFTLECDAELNEVDIANLSLRIPIFISTTQGNAYFKVLNITYYNSKEKSKITFQKVIL